MRKDVRRSHAEAIFISKGLSDYPPMQVKNVQGALELSTYEIVTKQ